MFSCKICEIFKNTYFEEHLWWLFLQRRIDEPVRDLWQRFFSKLFCGLKHLPIFAKNLYHRCFAESLIRLCYAYNLFYIETASWRVLLKKVFLKISQNLQENKCARVSFLTKFRPATLLKRRRDSSTSVFLWVLQHFKSIFFTEHLQASAPLYSIFLLCFLVVCKVVTNISGNMITPALQLFVN